MDNTEYDALAPTLEEKASVKELRVTSSQLADMLIQEGKIELNEGQSLVIQHMDSSDLLTAVEESEPTKQLGVLVEMMSRFSLEIRLEGSIALGPFNLADHSWTLSPGNSGLLRILAKPSTVRKPLSEIVSFLKKLPVGQALVLKPFQELFLEEISANEMFNYYQHCQENQDPISREKEQDSLFIKSCEALAETNLLLKVYGLNAAQIDRNIDTGAGGISFKPVSSSEFTSPRIVVGLVAKKPS